MSSVFSHSDEVVRILHDYQLSHGELVGTPGPEPGVPGSILSSALYLLRGVMGIKGACVRAPQESFFLGQSALRRALTLKK